MRWEEESNGAALARDADVTDVAFRLSGRWLPVDHAWALRDAVATILPWLEDEPGAGIHSIHVAASGNGWERPGLESGGMLSLSRRTPLVLRVPVHRADGTGALGDCRLDVGGCEIATGARQRRPLRPARAVFARYVLDDEGDGVAVPDDRRDETVRQLAESFHQPDVFQPNDEGLLEAVLDAQTVRQAARELLAASA